MERSDSSWVVVGVVVVLLDMVAAGVQLVSLAWMCTAESVRSGSDTMLSRMAAFPHLSRPVISALGNGPFPRSRCCPRCRSAVSARIRA